MGAELTFKTKSGDIKLVRQDLIEGKVSMRIPETLQESTREPLIKEMNGQNLIFTKSDKENGISITLIHGLVGDKLAGMPDERYLEMMTAGSRQALSRFAPGYQEIGVFTRSAGDIGVGCINYFMHGLDSETYHVFAIFRCGNDQYQFGFSCKDKDAEVWNLIFLACIDSLKTVEE